MSYYDFNAAKANLPVYADRAKVKAYRSEWAANRSLSKKVK